MKTNKEAEGKASEGFVKAVFTICEVVASRLLSLTQYNTLKHG
jgi:hypothetical protein